MEARHVHDVRQMRHGVAYAVVAVLQSQRHLRRQAVQVGYLIACRIERNNAVVLNRRKREKNQKTKPFGSTTNAQFFSFFARENQGDRHLRRCNFPLLENQALILLTLRAKHAELRFVGRFNAHRDISVESVADRS